MHLFRQARHSANTLQKKVIFNNFARRGYLGQFKSLGTIGSERQLKEGGSKVEAALEGQTDIQNSQQSKKKEISSASGCINIPDQDNLKKLKGFKGIVGDIPPQVKEYSEYLKRADDFKKMGAKIPRGILMVGPPGTGKTSIARAMAEEMEEELYKGQGEMFSYTNASDFATKWHGESEENIRKAFDCARKLAKKHPSKRALLFIDELDAIGSRTNLNDSNGDRGTRATMINTFLNQMDGFKHDNSLTVIGATNAAKDIDPALKRPGRFDQIIEIPLPNLKSRKEILKFYFLQTRCNLYSITDEYIEKLADITEGASGADLKNLVNESAIQAVKMYANYIEQVHVEMALKLSMENLNSGKKSHI